MPTPSHQALLSRVLAWHNRHPLARQIKASQVHSIGEVLLPFACAQAQPDPPEPAELALVSDFGLALDAPSPVAPPAAAGEAAIDMPTIDIELSEPSQAESPADPTLAVPSTAAIPVPAAAPGAALPSSPTQAQSAAPAQPLFSRSIVWPLSAAAIARWTRRHGQPQPLLPADSRRRRVEIDGQKQAAAASRGLPQLMHLHLLSAYIVDGDRRMRVLMSPAGAILGSRAYSRPRQATAAALLMAGMLGAGLGLGGVGAGGLQGWLASLNAAPQATASDAAVVAAAPASSSASASSAEPHAAVDSAAAAAAVDLAPPASSPPRLPASQQAHATSPPAKAEAQAEAPAATAAASAATLARVRPQLSDQDKRLAREQSAQLRASQQAAVRQAQAAAKQAKTPVYALVSQPSLQRDEAQRSLKLMHDARKRWPPPAPAQAELVQNQGLWRATWWPFGSRAEAERARVLLSGRGQRAEVVEF